MITILRRLAFVAPLVVLAVMVTASPALAGDNDTPPASLAEAIVAQASEAAQMSTEVRPELGGRAMDRAFTVSNFTLLAGYIVDESTTALFMSAGVKEGGWTTNFPGGDSLVGTALINGAATAGLFFLDRHLYAKGGKWRAAALLLNTYRSTSSVSVGFRNFSAYQAGKRAQEVAAIPAGRFVYLK